MTVGLVHDIDIRRRPHPRGITMTGSDLGYPNRTGIPPMNPVNNVLSRLFPVFDELIHFPKYSYLMMTHSSQNSSSAGASSSAAFEDTKVHVYRLGFWIPNADEQT